MSRLHRADSEVSGPVKFSSLVPSMGNECMQGTPAQKRRHKKSAVAP